MALDEKAQAAYAKRLDKYNENRQAEIDAAINEAFKTHAGRNLLWWLLEIGQINTQPFRGDEGRTAFACGELNVGNQILARTVAINPDGYLTMLKEKQSERHALRNDSAGSNSGEPGAYDDDSAGGGRPGEDD